MIRILTAATLNAAYTAKFAPASEAGTLSSIEASADKGHLTSVEASVKGFAPIAGALKWVEVVEHFFVAGETALIGDFVEIEEVVANRLINSGKAVEANAEKLKAAQAKAKGGTVKA